MLAYAQCLIIYIKRIFDNLLILHVQCIKVKTAVYAVGLNCCFLEYFLQVLTLLILAFFKLRDIENFASLLQRLNRR